MTDELTIIYKNPNELIPYVNNAKLHGDEQVRKIASSMKEFGFNNPVLLDGKDGVIAGHGRLKAALLLKLDSIPTIDLSHLSGARKKAYILADNRLAEIDSGYDDDLLKNELDHLSETGFDIDLTGFDIDEFIDDEDNIDEDYSHVNKEIDTSDFSNDVSLTFMLNVDDYRKVKGLLHEKDDDINKALMMALGL